MKKLKVYLAGPDVFRENAKEYGQQLKEKLKSVGLKSLYPFDNEVNTEQDLCDMAISIYKANIKMIKKCDVILANLDSFRSPSCDVGTAYEIGFARALKKTVIGYYSELECIPYKEKVQAFHTVIGSKDKHYPNIEDFDLCDNLMISIGCNAIYDSLDKALEGLMIMKGLKNVKTEKTDSN